MKTVNVMLNAYLGLTTLFDSLRLLPPKDVVTEQGTSLTFTVPHFREFPQWFVNNTRFRCEALRCSINKWGDLSLYNVRVSDSGEYRVHQLSYNAAPDENGNIPVHRYTYTFKLTVTPLQIYNITSHVHFGTHHRGHICHPTLQSFSTDSYDWFHNNSLIYRCRVGVCNKYYTTGPCQYVPMSPYFGPCLTVPKKDACLGNYTFTTKHDPAFRGFIFLERFMHGNKRDLL